MSREYDPREEIVNAPVPCGDDPCGTCEAIADFWRAIDALKGFATPPPSEDGAEA